MPSGCFTGDVSISAERARELMGIHVGDLPPGHRVDVWPMGSAGAVWLANCIDENGMPYAGSATLIGPDERLWVLSSNPSIHDLELGVRLLEEAYEADLAGLLDVDQFSQRLADITQRRDDDVRVFRRDLKGGSLRSRAHRHLP